MKKILIINILVLITKLLNAQEVITPNDGRINNSFLFKGIKEYDFYVKRSENSDFEHIGVWTTAVNLTQNKIIYNLKTYYFSDKTTWLETINTNNNLFPINRILLGKKYKGSTTFNNNNIKTLREYYSNNNIKEYNCPTKSGYFDNAVIPFVIQMLPLKSGFKGTIPVYDTHFPEKLHNIIIEQVTSDIYESEYTGIHDLWKVTALEESSGDTFYYFIDKKDHKLWGINIKTKENVNYQYIDRELDYDPYINKFNYEKTYNMMYNGGATIDGQSFRKDYEENNIPGLGNRTLINLNKKQFAPKGTIFTLFPYTPFFKEWFIINEKRIKKGLKPLTLTDEQWRCVKFTMVYDNDGHFEFTNLEPGDYYLTTTFNFIHTYEKTVKTGENMIFINGEYIGNEDIRNLFVFNERETDNLYLKITIKEKNEIKKVKIKKTNSLL